MRGTVGAVLPAPWILAYDPPGRCHQLDQSNRAMSHMEHSSPTKVWGHASVWHWISAKLSERNPHEKSSIVPSVDNVLACICMCGCLSLCVPVGNERYVHPGKPNAHANDINYLCRQAMGLPPRIFTVFQYGIGNANKFAIL